MPPSLIMAVALVFLVLPLIPLGSRWYKGCALAPLGAILTGAGTFGAGWYYLTCC
jgi:hypothetical protein